MSLLLSGTGVSKGIAIGQAYVLYRELPEVPEYQIAPKDVRREISRYKQALKQAQRHLNAIRKKIALNTPEDIVVFIDTHLLMMDDPILKDGVVQLIKQLKCNAESALQKQCDRLVAVFDEMDAAYLRTRKDDVQHVVHRIQRCLASQVEEVLDGDYLRGRIIVADDLTPADTLLMQHQKIAGFVTEYGGPLSHTAILSRSLGIPAVVGVHSTRRLIQADEWLVIDGDQGMVIADPDQRTLKYFRTLRRTEKERRANLSKLKNRPPITEDGCSITLHGNIDRPEDVRLLRQVEHTGVGLYRTEVLFLEKNGHPSEEEQFQAYRRVVRALRNNPLTIRTIDLGADKELEDTPAHGPLAHNPALGLRAIRRCLKEPELFLQQLRAILRVSSFGPVRMMLPMLTCVTELEQVLQLIEQAKNDLQQRRIKFDPDIKIGAMIEVPAAALSAKGFAQRLDFLSIGTNDLIQYTLAIDRIDDEVSYLYNPLHPSVLQLIDMTLKAGEQAGIPVSMCGEMASDPLYTRLLLGMGLQYFSVQTNTLQEIKEIILQSDVSRLKKRVRGILKCSTPPEVERRVALLNKGSSD